MTTNRMPFDGDTGEEIEEIELEPVEVPIEVPQPEKVPA